MVKRLHEYKRQVLKLLHVVTLYQRFKSNPYCDEVPRTVVFGAKAAPGYVMAKQTIELIHAVARAIESDPVVRERLRIAFPANYNVVLNQVIVPAAELSEQISMAGKEASGTGNMKFALNGALTIGTLDGANVEIRELVGPENFFLFGLTADEVAATWAKGYRPREIYERNVAVRTAIDLINSGLFSHGDRDLFRPLTDDLVNHDPYLVLADYASYADCQDEVDRRYQDTAQWTRMSILNVARIGRFSSDRSIRDYCRDIWKVPTLVVDLDTPS
jgi:starch phosphorylase